MEENLSEEMYKEHLLELYKSPENYGELSNPSNEYTETNSSCGDEITMQLIIKNDVVEDVKFQGSGCVMSIVSSSLLTDKIKGMKLEDVNKLAKDDILELLGIKIGLARLKCVLLPLYALKNSLK